MPPQFPKSQDLATAPAIGWMEVPSDNYTIEMGFLPDVSMACEVCS